VIKELNRLFLNSNGKVVLISGVSSEVSCHHIPFVILSVHPSKQYIYVLCTLIILFAH